MDALPDRGFSLGRAERLRIRSGAFTGPTSGLASGQRAGKSGDPAARRWRTISCALPRRTRSHVRCSAVSEPGEPTFPTLGRDLDIRTDLPRYRVWRHGELVEEPTDINHVWRDDLVSFAIGCSFSFEEALIEDGIEVRHISRGCNVPMYRTSIPCVAAGVFHGPLVVSMRPLRPADAIRAVQITSRFPSVHGAPVHLGMPEQIGIKDIGKPDYGDAVPVGPDELPVFWACGVTPQAAIAAVKPEFCITHAPGSMLITDLRNTKLAAL